MLKKRCQMKDLLLPLLRQVQKKEGYVSEASMKKISKQTGLPISQIYGAATFYAMIHTKPQGKYVIEICNSPSCYLNNSIDVIKALEEKLQIKSGDTAKDQKFSLHIGSCIGCCNEAPAMKINSTVYGNLTKEKINEILASLK
ncbi:NADH-quinone oxidoreductase subunit NuoE [Nanoarchaeota archaeon]